MESEKKYYSAIIPASLRYDRNVSANAKMLFCEIDALSRAYGYCWASEEYFADMFGVSAKSIHRWIKELAEYEHIFVEKTDVEFGGKKMKWTIYIINRHKEIDIDVQNLGQKCPKILDKNVHEIINNNIYKHYSYEKIPDEQQKVKKKIENFSEAKINKNKFINFEQRDDSDFDYSALEKKLVGNST